MVHGGYGKLQSSEALRAGRGFTLIEVLIVVAVIAILAGIAIPILASSRLAAREATAISHLRLFKTTMEQYRMDEGDYALEVGDLLNKGYVSGFSSFGNDVGRSGYLFHMDHGPLPEDWGIQANPITPGFTGRRFFYMSALGDIHFNNNGPAAVTDIQIQ